MQRRFIETREGRFCLVITERAAGAEDRGSVLYLHGFPDEPETATPLFDRLAAAGHRVIAPFLRGYSPSPIEGPFSLEQLTRDVLAIVDVVHPDGAIHVIGHDWGAVITYALCASAPSRVRRAVTMAVPHPLRFLRALATATQLRRSWYMLFFQLPIAPGVAVRAMDQALIDRLWRDWSPNYALPARAREALRRCLRESDGAPIEYYRAMTRPPLAALRRLRGPLAQRIDVPTLHLQGSDDGCIGLDACDDAGAHFNAAFEQAVIEGAGHFLPQERPDEVARRASEWFSR
jgi:pimeloyl-ACP methyl ester carboxylesterase